MGQVTCLSTEAGKTLADAEAEIIRGLDSIQSACSVGQEMAGMYNMSETTQTYTLSEPLVRLLVTGIRFRRLTRLGCLRIYNPV